MPYPGRNPGQLDEIQSMLGSKAAASDPYIRAALENRQFLAEGGDRMNAPHTLMDMMKLFNQRNQAIQGAPGDPNPFAPAPAAAPQGRTSSSTLTFTPGSGGAGSTQVSGAAGNNRASAQSFQNQAVNQVRNNQAQRGSAPKQQPPRPSTGVGLNNFFTR